MLERLNFAFVYLGFPATGQELRFEPRTDLITAPFSGFVIGIV